MALSFSANAERYLVRFKSAETFKNVSKTVSEARKAGTQASGVKLFGANTNVTESFDQLGMVVIETQDPTAIASLRGHPAIALVEKEIFHPLPQPMATHGPSVALKTSSRRPMDMPWGIAAVKAPEAWSVTRGDGARVMVLDTGLDVNHEAVKSRIEKFRNFTGGSATDITDQVGHGTHVSGTILADGADGGLVGVAPEARLLMGKVCSTNGCSSVAIAGGINWAVQEHADVVNMSLGGLFMSDGEAQAIKAAEAAGVFIAAASGNGGVGYVSYPAAADEVLAVGAVDSTLAKADFSQWGPQLDVMGPGVDTISSVPLGTGRDSSAAIELENKGMTDIKSLPFVGSPVVPNVENELVYAGLGKPEDFLNVDVRGKFALISRGEITFKDKVANAIQAGAVGAVIFNNEAGLLQGTLSEDGTEVAIPAVMIEKSVGDEAQAILASGGAVRASFSVNATDYASFQGTSMATPHVAGVAALVRAANSQLTPAQVRDILKSTATALGPNDENQYGSGLVNAQAAVAAAQAALVPAALRVAN